MGIFDFFKKKVDLADLSLEVLLQKAAGEPAYRMQFYDRLLSGDLVVLTDKKGNTVNGMLKAGSSVNIISLQDGRIPVFTSPERILDKGAIKDQVPYLQMSGQSLFEMTAGATLMLNPYSDFGKELLPAEIEQLLNGTIAKPSKKIVVEKETQVQIGQPAVYPHEIVNSLKILFTGNPLVTAAYLGWIYNPEGSEPPHYIFGIEGGGNLSDLTGEAGFIAEGYLGKNEIVDFIEVNDTSSLSEYFKSTTPFYIK